MRHWTNIVSDCARTWSHVKCNWDVEFFCQTPVWFQASIVRRHAHELRHEFAQDTDSSRSEFGAKPCGVGELRAAGKAGGAGDRSFALLTGKHQTEVKARGIGRCPSP